MYVLRNFKNDNEKNCFLLTLLILCSSDQSINQGQVNPNSIWEWGGQITPCNAKFRKKCPCSHNNSTALITQISLFDTASSHDK